MDEYQRSDTLGEIRLQQRVDALERTVANLAKALLQFAEGVGSPDQVTELLHRLYGR